MKRYEFETTPEAIGYFLGKLCAAGLATFLIVNYSLPVWLVFILILLF